MLDRYRLEGGPLGELGRPVGGEQRVTPSPDAPMAADREIRFERGVIYLDRATGATTVRVDTARDRHSRP